MTLTERIGQLSEAIRKAEEHLDELTPSTEAGSIEAEEDLWWNLSPEEREAYWESSAGQAESELSRLEGQLQYVLEGKEYYHWREEPAVRVHVLSATPYPGPWRKR